METAHDLFFLIFIRALILSVERSWSNQDYDSTIYSTEELQSAVFLCISSSSSGPIYDIQTDMWTYSITIIV